jgi:hypothetical protein
MAIGRERPVPRTRTSASATAETSVIESAMEYASLSTLLAGAHKHLAQNHPGKTPTKIAAKSARISSETKTLLYVLQAWAAHLPLA